MCHWGSEVPLRCRVSLVFALRWKERLLVLLGVLRLPPVGLTGGSGAKELSMATVKEEDRAKLEKFDGTDPSAYKRWRRKAELMLLALPNTFEKSRWGPKLCEYVSGEAEELIEDISVADLCKEGGYKDMLDALDQKYSKRKEEEVQHYLKEYFYRCTIRQNETFRQFVVRLETTYKKLAEHGIDLPSTVKGWMLMKKMHLDMTQEALILTSTSGSLKYEDVTTALTKVLPEGCNRRARTSL